MVNRIFKFRAWCQRTASIKSMEYLEAHTHGLRLFRQDGAWSDGFVFMQFTGLKDKNDVEIYEGDIVRMFSAKGNEYGICVVEFVPHRGSSEYVFTEPINKKEVIAEYSYICMEMNEGWSVEVVGNIHENPDLLEPR